MTTLQARKQQDPDPPFIPFETIDAPSQRLYVAAFYLALWLWRFYDFSLLQQEQEESFWLFLKWISIDGAFLFGLPSLRIPWLEWTGFTMTILFFAHGILDGMLMFRIPIPLIAWVFGVLKWGTGWGDSELAISESSVNPNSILRDPSHILGGYTIHVLPEGSAVLNPYEVPLCVGGTKSSYVQIPLQLNQTNPTSIELIRFDLTRDSNESVKLSSSQTRKLIKAAEQHRTQSPDEPLLLEYTATKPGLYRLGRVLDSLNQEVGHQMSEALVVQCPKASIKPSGANRCRGDLSNIKIEVEGTPPLKIKYRKTVNGEDKDVTYQSIQPDDFASPIVRQDSPDRSISLAASRVVTIPLNETLARGGLWSYSIDRVTDAYGNVVSYTDIDSEYDSPKAKASHLEDEFMVHERPAASFDSHYSRQPLRRARGQVIPLPLRLKSGGKPADDEDYQIEYKFTPTGEVTSGTDHGENVRIVPVTASNSKQIKVSQPGLYSLVGVKSHFCGGDVEEPTSFMLVNPPEPQIGMSHEVLNDKCADRPIGLHIDLHMSGTPPFRVMYTYQRQGSGLHSNWATFDGPQGQLNFRPDAAGKWTYKLVQMEDAIYNGIDLRSQNLMLQQDVRPSVGAAFTRMTPDITACIDEPVTFDVKFQGEGPWTLEYELVHGRQRTKREIHQIGSDCFTITTDRLTQGGEYSLVLTGVKDRQGCREPLQQDAKFSVRHQRPKASFGQIDGKRSVKTLESKHVELPLRLAGEGPWSINFQHSVVDNTGNKQMGPVQTKHISRLNDFLEISDPGTYAIVGVRDALCPGTVDDKAQSFDVAWVARPQVSIVESPLMQLQAGKYVRNDVCEGDEDATDVNFTGRPPYDVKYQEHFKPDKGSISLRNFELNVPLHSAQIKLDTVQPGTYDYVFSELGDYNYDHDSRRHQPLTIQQRVQPRPAVSFDQPGKVYSFCQSQDTPQASEHVPATFQGLPPFHVDLEIRHQGASRATKPDELSIPHVPSHSTSLNIPHRLLQAGSSIVTVRRVRDARGCERQYSPSSALMSSSGTQRQAALANAPPRIQVAVHDAPTLAPLDSRTHHCVGERLSFALSGTAPFNVHYTFQGSSRKAPVPSATFRRLAEIPGQFTINGLNDAASACKAEIKDITRTIHDIPRVRVSKGHNRRFDIHAGGTADVLFEFEGEPPFEFTYTRSEAPRTRNKKDGKGGIGGEYGKPGKVLETRTQVSQEKTMRISESEEGSYEVVAIQDRWCSYARPGYEGLIGRPKDAGTDDRRVEWKQEKKLLED